MKNDHKDDALNALFEAARNERPRLSSEKIESIVASGMSHARSKRSEPPRKRKLPIVPWLPAISGLGAVTALGVWIGIVVPFASSPSMTGFTPDDAFDLSTFLTGADYLVISTEELDL